MKFAFQNMDYDNIPCFKCQNITQGCNEGYFCDKCGSIANLCHDCHGPMKLLNYYWEWQDSEQYNNFSAIYPPENVGKEFRALNDEGDDFDYIDDQTRFYWRCDKCNLEEITDCD